MTNVLDMLASHAYDFARSHSYIALDVPSLERAKSLVELFGEAVDGYKVGLELFHAAGMDVVEWLVRGGKRVFLDVKLHDIPNTVAGALRVLRDSGIDMVNVHALGGAKMLEAARNALEGSAHRPQLIAVTVLTSLGDDALHQMQLPPSSALVPQLAQLAYQCGLTGWLHLPLISKRFIHTCPRRLLRSCQVLGQRAPTYMTKCARGRRGKRLHPARRTWSSGEPSPRRPLRWPR